jgi:hypothetical protein
MAKRQDRDPQPPAPPRFERRLRFGRAQLVGVGLLALLPLAALTGVLGAAEREASASSGALTLEARYASTIHYKGSHTFVFDLRNDGEGPLHDARLRVDEAYLSRFEGVRFTPPVVRLDPRHAEVALGDIEAGATRRVLLELQASEYGRPQGSVVALSADSGEARVQLSTLVLP